MPIRQYQPSTEDFVDEFQDNIIPSAIPSSEFINWDGIENDITAFEEQIEAIAELQDVSKETFNAGLADALMKADDTRKWIDFYFEILGERGNKYSALEGLWKFYDVQRAIDGGDREAAEDLAAILHEIGLQYVVEASADVRDHIRGMMVGMESHSRKNRQGTCFEKIVEERLSGIVDTLQEEGHEVTLKRELTTEYNDESGQKKTVDFAILENGDLQVVFEANCYKVGGSKPSEIRRSYNHVAERMRNDGVGFVWVTDGQGWAKSLTNVLRQSYEDITDVYNLYQVDKNLEDDILTCFEKDV